MVNPGNISFPVNVLRQGIHISLKGYIMLSNKINKTVVATKGKNAVDLSFLNIPQPEDLIDLEEIENPLVRVETFLGVPVVLHENPEIKLGTKTRPGETPSNYYIFTVQDIATGETWKSSIGHWFMKAYVEKCHEKGVKPFPIAVVFYEVPTPNGVSYKFKGVRSEV